MVQRYEQMRRLQWYKRGAAYFLSNLGKMQSTEADSKYSAFVLFFTLSTYPSLDSTFAVTTTSVLT